MKFLKSFFLVQVLLGWLSFSLLAQEIHVSKSGNDSNSGTSDSPYLTISKAASVAEPGDVILIHEGTYREYVNPTKGGTSEDKRVTFKAAEGEEVFVKGSEQIDTWKNNNDNTWSITLASDFFNGYNPYELTVSGNFQNYGHWHHRGDVYINNGALAELQTLEQVKDEPYTWYTITEDDKTTIYANFGTEDPNNELTEINVRELIFFAVDQGVNYITVDGLRFLHAAPNWQAPNISFDLENRTAQVGAVGANNCKYWIVQNCEVSYSKTAGIMFGEAEDPTFLEDITKFGDHIIRDNVITRCGEYAIAGQKGLSRSTISGNRIEDINYRQEFGGWETSGIKVWNCVDITIDNNLVRRVSTDMTKFASSHGIWIDYANQGIRISRNYIESGSKTHTALYLEANVGPILVDNNIIVEVQGRTTTMHSGGCVFAHNLFINSTYGFDIQPFGEGGAARDAYTLKPHTMESTNVGIGVEPVYNQMYNNIFAGGGGPKKFSANSGAGNKVDHNLYIGGTKPSTAHTNSYTSSFDFTHKIDDTETGIDITFEIDDSYKDHQTPTVNADLVGNIPHAEQTIEDKNGNPITVNTDFVMANRTANPVVGPLEGIQTGENKISIGTAIKATPGAMYDVPVSIPPVVEKAPYNGTPHKIPGAIEAEEYDLGGQGVSYNDDNFKEGNQAFRPEDNVDIGDDGGDGKVVGWFYKGEWLEYTVDIEAGIYTIEIVAGSELLKPGSLELAINGKQIAVIDVTSTGSWSSYKTISVENIEIKEATEAVLRVKTTGIFNLDKMEFIRTAGVTTSVNETEFAQQVMYPNPVKDVLYVRQNSVEIPTVQIFTTDGKQIISEHGTQVNVSQLKSGMYFISIDKQNKQMLIKK